MVNPRPITTTMTREVKYVTKLTVADMQGLMTGAPSYAEVKVTEHKGDGQLEPTSYSVKVTWQ